MNTIWKFELDEFDKTLLMPKGAMVLSVGNQAERLVLWALVDSQAPSEPRRFLTTGTGQEAPVGADYYGTVAFPLTGLVWHVFEVEIRLN